MSETARARRVRNSGYRTVAERQAARCRHRVESAATAEEQVTAAFDWLRLAASRMPAEGRADVLNRAAQALAGLAVEAEKGRDVSRQVRAARKAGR